MSSKARPWDRPDVKVFRPESISTIEYDSKERKAVDTATGEYLVMAPDSHGGPGQFVFGTLTEGMVGSGGYTSNWYPEERISVLFINALSTRTPDPSRHLSRSEFDAAPIARMMRAVEDAAAAANPGLVKLQGHLPPARVVVIDTRPETPTDAR